MDFSFLPNDIYSIIINRDVDKLTEIRIRDGYPISVVFDGKYQKLLCSNIIANKNHIQEIVDNVTERSIYAFNNCIKQGFLTTKDGIRIGLCGECVFDNNKVVTIKNFSSLNIRIPHLIKDCSCKIISAIMQNNQIFNTLIVSPPGKGKTTILKDIIIKFNNLNCGQILVIDERNEFSLVSGENVDRVVYSNKDYAFNFAIRSMSPEIVVTDELASNEDWGFVNNAVNSGIKVIASCHAGTKNELQEKECFINNLFERYVFLKNTNIPGVLDHIFDSNFIEL